MKNKGIIVVLGLIILGLLAYIGLNQEKDLTTDISTQPQTQDDLVSYTNQKFGISFSHNPSYLLTDPNRPMNSGDFSIDGSGNGHQYRCPLVNNSNRLYTEKEVVEGNINISGCSYEAPNLDTAAQSKLTARWTSGVYGGIPTIHNIVVAGRPARLIYATNDYRTLIISLAVPYKENGYTYDFLDIGADKLLMDDIIRTLKLN